MIFFLCHFTAFHVFEVSIRSHANNFCFVSCLFCRCPFTLVTFPSVCRSFLMSHKATCQFLRYFPDYVVKCVVISCSTPGLILDSFGMIPMWANMDICLLRVDIPFSQQHLLTKLSFFPTDVHQQLYIDLGDSCLWVHF